MLESEDCVTAFVRMVKAREPLAANVVRVDSSSQFQRDVTVITVEIPNEALEQYAALPS